MRVLTKGTRSWCVALHCITANFVAPSMSCVFVYINSVVKITQTPSVLLDCMRHQTDIMNL